MPATYMKQLDGLRAFAVLAVMVAHFTLSNQGMLGRVSWGQLGVKIFFVLSGFLITGILLRSRSAVQAGWADRGQSLRIFYYRRFLRIFPVYYATIAAAILLNIKPFRQTFLWHVFYLTNLREVLYHPLPNASTHFWTLAVEEQFYLVWPCLILLAPRRHLLKVIITTICIAPVFRLVAVLLDIRSAEGLLFGCLDTLGMGALLAYVTTPEYGSPALASRFSRIMLWIGLPAFALGMIARALRLESSTMMMTLFDLALAFIFAWIVGRAASSIGGPVGALLELKPLRYVGKISYGVYVLHPFTTIVLFYTLKFTGQSLSENSPIRFVILVAMAIAAASVSWHFFEGPINAYKRHWDYPKASAKEKLKNSDSSSETLLLEKTPKL
jgi:peptidoglycan/LPS O-acetylase OafA/YrhL